MTTAKLILTAEGKTLEEIPIDKDVLTIGRVEGNDIRIESLAVSSHHAKIVTIETDALIQDLGSTNGTYVNKQKITQHALEDGDVITIGTHLLRYRKADDTAEAPSGPGLNGKRHVAAALATLRIEGGPDDGREIVITKRMTTLGRPGEHVAAIAHRSDGFHCLHVDGGEDNARTLVNGEPVPAEGRLLQDDDELEVAGVKMRFRQAEATLTH